MVVPEAFLVNGEDYEKVYVVTSQSSACPFEEINKFFADRPDTQLLFHRVEGFNQLEQDGNTITLPKPYCCLPTARLDAIMAD